MTKATQTLKITAEIKRGDKPLTEVSVREPKAGDLRGLKLFDIMQADVDAMATLLPRITTPPLISEDVYEFNLADCAAAAVIIADFTAPSSSSPTA